MTQSEYYVDKTTHTFADSLVTFGFVAVLEEIVRRSAGNGSIRVKDDEWSYRVTCKPGIEAAWLESATTRPVILAPIIRTAKNADKLPGDLIPACLVDYEATRDANGTYWTAVRNMSPDGRRAWSKRSMEHPEVVALPPSPHRDWDVFRALNPAGLIGYNSLLAQWWEQRDRAADLLRLLLSMFSITPNDRDASEAEYKRLAKEHGYSGASQATAAQLYNPAQGKGQNRSKADSLGMGNVREFWLLEYLKAVGFYRAGFTRLLRGTKDRKSYVIAPGDVELNVHDRIMGRFRARMPFSEAATRSDILVALRYSQEFLQYAQEDEAGSGHLLERLLRGDTPRDSIRGFYVAFYKNLGNSAATMNLSFINLPAWIHLSATDAVEDYLDLLAEHEQIVVQLDESHSDAAELLSRYRDFIVSDDLSPFFEFTTAYGGYVISQRERSKYAPQLTEENLRRLFMNVDARLSEILDPEIHPGFRNIADAIRQSTVTAQYRKKQGDRRYDVRYGLGQELARKARYPEEFVTALSDFLHRYNAENAQVMENRRGPYRKSVKTGDIDDIVSLVDRFGSELICNLLIAYGYARTGAQVENHDAVEASLEGDLPEQEATSDGEAEDGTD